MPELIVDVICSIEHGEARGAFSTGSSIENLREVTATAIAHLEAAVVSVQEIRERFGLSDTATDIIVRAIFAGYGAALQVATEMREEADPDILIEVAKMFEAAFAKLRTSPPSLKRLLTYYKGDVEELTRKQNFPGDLRAAHHPGRKRGHPKYTADLRAFAEPIAKAWRDAGLKYPARDATRAESRSTPLAHDLIRWLVIRFFGARRANELTTILREI
jgi:hypothetical protein